MLITIAKLILVLSATPMHRVPVARVAANVYNVASVKVRTEDCTESAHNVTASVVERTTARGIRAWLVFRDVNGASEGDCEIAVH
jgi:hypothetical protein